MVLKISKKKTFRISVHSHKGGRRSLESLHFIHFEMEFITFLPTPTMNKIFGVFFILRSLCRLLMSVSTRVLEQKDVNIAERQIFFFFFFKDRTAVDSSLFVASNTIRLRRPQSFKTFNDYSRYNFNNCFFFVLI